MGKNRHVVVIDRGWIFAGDLAEANGRITLTRVVWVFDWSNITFDEVLVAPKHERARLKPMKHAVDIPCQSEIYRIPVSDDWGL